MGEDARLDVRDGYPLNRSAANRAVRIALRRGSDPSRLHPFDVDRAKKLVDVCARESTRAGWEQGDEVPDQDEAYAVDLAINRKWAMPFGAFRGLSGPSGRYPPPMSYSSYPSQRFKIENRVVRRAWADHEYRSRLLADPKAAVAEELGVALPDKLDVRVVEERSDLLYIVLPVDTSTIPSDLIGVMMGRPPA